MAWIGWGAHRLWLAWPGQQAAAPRSALSDIADAHTPLHPLPGRSPVRRCRATVTFFTCKGIDGKCVVLYCPSTHQVALQASSRCSCCCRVATADHLVHQLSNTSNARCAQFGSLDHKSQHPGWHTGGFSLSWATAALWGRPLTQESAAQAQSPPVSATGGPVTPGDPHSCSPNYPSLLAAAAAAARPTQP